MALSRLELISSYGDQTLPRVRFVVHGTGNATDTLSILEAGLRFTEGRPVVSTDIIHAHDWTVSSTNQAGSLGSGVAMGEPGAVLVCAVPPNFHLGYGIFTTAYIDRAQKRVSGAPLRYAEGRKQLAFYTSADTEAARIHIEAEIANGYALEQRPEYVLEPTYLVGTFSSGGGFDALISQFDVSLRSLQAVEFERLESSFRDMFRPTAAGNPALVPTAIRDVIVGAVESMLISRLRMMRWQGLGLLGYSFAEGNREVQVPPVSDLVEQRRRMDELGRLLASSALFGAELAWLKIYVAHELELMRVELEGAELESLAD